MKRVLIGLEPEEIMVLIKALRESQMVDDEAKIAVDLHDRLSKVLSGV